MQLRTPFCPRLGTLKFFALEIHFAENINRKKKYSWFVRFFVFLKSSFHYIYFEGRGMHATSGTPASPSIVGPQERTRVIRLGRCLHPLSYMAGQPSKIIISRDELS